MKKTFRTYNTNYVNNFFEHLTEYSFYTLGIICSDGTLYRDRNIIAILMNDRDVVEKIDKAISTKARSRVKQVKDGRFRLRIENNKLYNEVLDLGIKPNKSKTLKIPRVCKFNRHFWRGMIDGDGWISCKEIGLCGTISVCKDFLNFVKSLKINTNSHVLVDKTSTNFARIKINGQFAKQLGTILYQNALIYGERKYNNFINYY